VPADPARDRAADQGPAATARPWIAPHRPIAAPRFSVGNASLIHVSVSGSVGVGMSRN
jgi:hypothetical protein